MPYTPIGATLGYVLSPARDRVLMIHRNAREQDHHLGKYNGLGGKLEPDEDVLSGMRREIREEAGIECEALDLRGTISWPGFGKGGEDWLGFVFLVTLAFGLSFLLPVLLVFLELVGVVQPETLSKYRRYAIFLIFLFGRFRGTPLERNAEGALEWIELGRLGELPMWEGDRHFLPLVFDADPRPFHGVMPYRDGRMQSWRYSR